MFVRRLENPLLSHPSHQGHIIPITLFNPQQSFELFLFYTRESWSKDKTMDSPLGAGLYTLCHVALTFGLVNACF